MITLVAAMTTNRVIGKENKLPWHLPGDMRHFRKTTMDKLVLMGRKTFESIGAPLKGRVNLILSHDREYKPEGVAVIHDLQTALTLSKTCDVYVIGGQTLYEQFLPHADRLILTRIDAEMEGDAYFPTFNPAEFVLVSRFAGEDGAGYSLKYSFETWERKK